MDVGGKGVGMVWGSRQEIYIISKTLSNYADVKSIRFIST
jgi:hypothetical protein